MSRLLKHSFLFFFGGISYVIIELLWRGRSHVSMYVLGGLCFTIIGFINEKYTQTKPLIGKMLISTLAITALEFTFGCIINIFLCWNVWDYSRAPLNIMGQICLPYMLLWFILTPVCIISDSYLRYLLFDGEKPSHRLF